jgi:hypothetical protein
MSDLDMLDMWTWKILPSPSKYIGHGRTSVFYVIHSLLVFIIGIYTLVPAVRTWKIVPSPSK